MAPFARILLCYDGTSEGRTALRCGAALVRQLNAEAHLLAIRDCSYWARGFDVLSAVNFDLDEEATKSILKKGIDQLRDSKVTAPGHFLVGNPVDEIPRLTNTLKVDLIVIGHRHESAFARWWTGANYALLLNRVSCGVLFEVASAATS